MSLEADTDRIGLLLSDISTQVVKENFLPNAPNEQQFKSTGAFRRELHRVAEPAFQEFERLVQQKLATDSDRTTYQLFRDHYYQAFYSGRILASVQVK